MPEGLVKCQNCGKQIELLFYEEFTNESHELFV